MYGGRYFFEIGDSVPPCGIKFVQFTPPGGEFVFLTKK